MRKLLRLGIGIGITAFLLTQAPDLIRTSAGKLRDQAPSIMPVAMR